MGYGMLKYSHARITQLLMFIDMKMCWFFTSLENGKVGIVKEQTCGRVYVKNP